MTDAQPETDGPLVAPYLSWLPRRDAGAMWLAVTSVDAQGRESAFSKPVYLRLR